MAQWVAGDEPSQEIAYRPARVLMQDFTGVPAIVDLAAMRDAMDELGGDPARINPLVPVELVIDHSIQVDVFGERLAFQRNAELEFERNRERYAFLRWGQSAFDNFKVVPPNTGICHQVNLEYLGRVVETRDGQAFPDTLVGTDSHTTMINGLGVLGWGVGGIEAEAAMLGQPVSMLIPQVVGFRLEGELPEGSTATDLVLTVTQMLRERGVVGKLRGVLRPGPAEPAAGRPGDDRQHGARVRRHLRHLPGGRRDAALPRVLRPPAERVELVEAYCREQGLFHDEGSEEAAYSDTLELDLGDVVPSARRARSARRTGWRWATPRERLPGRAGRLLDDERARRLRRVGGRDLSGQRPADRPTAAARPPSRATAQPRRRPPSAERREGLDHGAVVIAAITSCTNTSNPSVMLGAGLLAQEGGRGRAGAPAVGQDLAGAGLQGGDRVPRARRADRAAVGSSASTSWATAAPPASATPGRCPRRSRGRSRSATWWWPRCCRATATSRAASTPR